MLFSQTLSGHARSTATVSGRGIRSRRNVIAQSTGASHVLPLEPRQLMSVSVGSDGYTDVVKSSDSRVVYVSSSSGSDSNSGLTSDKPLKTVAKGISMMRSGMPDEVLLKRGDSWKENLSWTASGRSSQEPALLGAYGSGERPTIRAGAGTGLDISKGTVSNVVVQGIHFYADTRDPNGGSFSRTNGGYGIRFVANTSNALIEDCEIDYFQLNVLLMPYGGGSQSNVKLRRDVINNAYSIGDSSSGIYAQGVNGLTLEDNVFDHNGWNEKVSGAAANIYSHDAYLSEGNNNVVITGNIFANASSHGLQTRAGGTVTNNLFLDDPIGMSYGMVNGAALKAGGVTGTVSGNVFTESRTINGSGRGWAIELGNIKSATVSDNIITDDSSQQMAAIKLGAGDNLSNASQGVGIDNLTIENNVVNKWFLSMELAGELQMGASGNQGVKNLTVRDNDFQNTDNPWNRIIQHSAGVNTGQEHWSDNSYYDNGADSQWFLVGSTTTSIGSWKSKLEGSAQATKVAYNNPNASIAGYAGSDAAFLSAASDMSSSNYRSTYTAKGAINYFRSAFNKSSTPTPTPTPDPTPTPTPTPDPTPTPTPSETAPSGYGVSKLVLVNTDTGKDITALTQGMTVSLGSTPASHVAIRADVSGSAKSVLFGLDGNSRFNVESYAPFAMAGDVNGVLSAAGLSAGQHTVTATAFAQLNAAGAGSAPLSATFTLVQGVSESSNPPITTGDTTKPTVVDKGTANYQVWVRFSEPVGSSLSASDLVVTNTRTGAKIPISSVLWQSGQNIGVWKWVGYNGGKLPSGTYKATLAAGNVTDAAGNSLASDWSVTFSV